MRKWSASCSSACAAAVSSYESRSTDSPVSSVPAAPEVAAAPEGTTAAVSEAAAAGVTTTAALEVAVAAPEVAAAAEEEGAGSSSDELSKRPANATPTRSPSRAGRRSSGRSGLRMEGWAWKESVHSSQYRTVGCRCGDVNTPYTGPRWVTFLRGLRDHDPCARRARPVRWPLDFELYFEAL